MDLDHSPIQNRKWMMWRNIFLINLFIIKREVSGRNIWISFEKMRLNLMKDTCLNGMNDVEEISPLRGLVAEGGMNSLLQRLGREAAGIRRP
jgi:hypothetical protein